MVLKPWKKNIDAVLHVHPRTNLKQLRVFIGMVNYYRDVKMQASILSLVFKLAELIFIKAHNPINQ
jgi:hypothetical protein